MAMLIIGVSVIVDVPHSVLAGSLHESATPPDFNAKRMQQYTTAT